MENILVDPISHGVIQPNLIDFSPVQVLGLGGGATPAGDNGALQFNDNGALGGTIFSSTSGVPSLNWDTTISGGSLAFGDGWGDKANLWFDGSFHFQLAVGRICYLNTSGLTMEAGKNIGTPAISLRGTPFASLPPAGYGYMACVNDGAAGLAWGAPVTGGGSTRYLVWYNGSAWTVIGQ